MFTALTAIFALVTAAAGLVGLALLTSRVAALTRSWDSAHKATWAELGTTTNAALRAEVDDLRAALDVTRASNRKELGSLWARVGGKSNGEASQAASFPSALAPANDPDFQALLDLQNRPPTGP